MKRFTFFMVLLSFVGLAACEQEPVSITTEDKLTLSVNLDEIKVDGVAVFSVKLNDEDVTKQSVIYNKTSEGNIQLEGNTFMATAEGEYTFFAMNGALKSNEVNVRVSANAPEPPKVLTLTPSTDEIKADGEDAATFTVDIDGYDVTTDSVIYCNDGNNSVALEEPRFTTTVEGEYSFYAAYKGADNSPIVVVTAVKVEQPEPVEEPITLSADRNVIKANGIDSIRFTVEQEGNDVTTSSEIYVNGGRLNGSHFVTTTPGEYTVYAKKGSVESNTITITAEEVTATGTTIVFADGVTLTSGWYDVNKMAKGDNGDINMCWAATSSNMIQWWQDRYVAAGNTLPSTAISGSGAVDYPGFDRRYELALMDMFHSEWDNSRGGHMEEAIPWYFEGVLNGGEYASPGSQAVPKTDGGYWKSIWSSVTPYMYCGYDSTVGYTVCYNNYYLWGNGSDLLGVERLAYFSRLVVEAFDYGMAGLTISLSSNGSSAHHATTLWGYEIDNATGLITRLWITDSDDLDKEPKTPLLNEYRVSIDEGKSPIKMTGDTRYGACYVVSIHPLSMYGSAK